MEKFKLEVPTKSREKDAIEFIDEFIAYGSEINGTGGLNRYTNDYDAWLKKLEADYTRVPSEEKVPARTYFLVRENDNKIVGMINIRLALNERLRRINGHIGYSIRPQERQKGYNKINLYLGLMVCQKYGIHEVLMDCDKTNVASAKTMQALGARLVSEYFDEEEYNTLIQKYTIDVDKSLEKYKEIYMPQINSNV